MQRRFYTAAWVVLVLWVGRMTLLPARLQGMRVSHLSGERPTYAHLYWSYGRGARPLSIIFDLELDDASGSVTTDGEAQEAEVPLIGSGSARSYRISASATYRILGAPHTRVYQVEQRGA